jgi:excisionase family DNA binding protein
MLLDAKPVRQEQIRPQLAFSVKDFAAALGVSPSLVRHELKLARIRSFRLGRRLLIPRSEIERLAGNAALD